MSSLFKTFSTAFILGLSAMAPVHAAMTCDAATIEARFTGENAAYYGNLKNFTPFVTDELQQLSDFKSSGNEECAELERSSIVKHLKPAYAAHLASMANGDAKAVFKMSYDAFRKAIAPNADAEQVSEARDNYENPALVFQGLAFPGSWQEVTYRDDMRGETRYVKIAQSLGTKKLDYPYNKAKGVILITQAEKDGALLGTVPVVSISEGQMTPGQKTLLARFDNGDVREFAGDVCDDKNQTFCFEVADGAAFMNAVKQAKKVIIEVKFFQNGRTQFHFNLEDLRLR